MTRRAIVAGDAHPALARAIAAAAAMPLVLPRIEAFPDGETRLSVPGDLAGGDFYLIQPLSPPANEHAMRLLLLADALRAAGAQRVSAVVPYFAYARQDTHAAGEPRSANLLARLIETAGVARLFVIDLHAPALESAFGIPVEQLRSDSVLLEVVREACSDPVSVVVAPDAGALKRAQRYAAALGVPVAGITKACRSPDAVEALQLLGEVRDRACLIVDDMASTGGTIERAALALRAAGAAVVNALFVHPVMAPGALEKMLAAGVVQIFTSDTVPCPAHPKVHQASVACLLAEAVRRYTGCLNGAGETQPGGGLQAPPD